MILAVASLGAALAGANDGTALDEADGMDKARVAEGRIVDEPGSCGTSTGSRPGLTNAVVPTLGWAGAAFPGCPSNLAGASFPALV
jgi:hypothetical protein